MPFTPAKYRGAFEIDVYFTKAQTKAVAKVLSVSVAVELGVEKTVDLVASGVAEEICLQVDDATEIHALMRQPAHGGNNAHGSYQLSLMAFDVSGTRLAHTNDLSDWVESSIVFRIPRRDAVIFLLQCVNSGTGTFGCTVSVFASRKAQARFVGRLAKMPNLERFHLKHDKPAGDAQHAGFVDDLFHNRVKQAAPRWAWIYDLFPDAGERIGTSIIPEKVDVTHVEADEDGPAVFACLAGLTRHPALLKRFFGPHPKNKAEPHVFEFPDANGRFVPVTVDARVPVRGTAAHSPRRHWWPPLFEKAYAKHKGGYDRIRDLDAGSMMWDLLHRPVHRLSLRPPPGAAHYPRADIYHDFKHPRYWSKLCDEAKSGSSILVARTIPEPPDNLHKRSYYAVTAVVELDGHSDDAFKTIICLHNSYDYAPHYSGPLHAHDSAWTEELRRLCNFKDDGKSLYLPLPTFIANFYEMYKCATNLGEATTLKGEWSARSAGGAPGELTFRQNPIFVLENRASHAIPVTVVLRHVGNDDGAAVTYPETGIAVMQPTNPNVSAVIPTCLLTGNNHKQIHSSDVEAAATVTTTFEVEAGTLSYIVPFTPAKLLGTFELDLFFVKGQNKAIVGHLMPKVYMRSAAEVVVSLERVGATRELHLHVAEATEIHLLLKQRFQAPKAAEVITVGAFDEHGKRVGGTLDPTNCTESSLVFRAQQRGVYGFAIRRAAGDVAAPLLLELSAFTAKMAFARFVHKDGALLFKDPLIPAKPSDQRRSVSGGPARAGGGEPIPLPPAAALATEPHHPSSYMFVGLRPVRPPAARSGDRKTPGVGFGSRAARF